MLLGFFLGLCGVLRAQNVEFSQISDPVSIVNQTTFPLPGATVSTVTAPDPYTSYRFAYPKNRDGIFNAEAQRRRVQRLEAKARDPGVSPAG